MRRRSAKRKIWRRVIFFVALAAIMMWLGSFLWFVKSLDLTEMPDGQLTDGIVVLTGGPNRIKEAVGLLEQGLGQRLLISGVNQTVSPETLRRALDIAPEIFRCCIDLGRTALNTRDNAIEASDWARAHHYRSLRVVTSLDHMPRSLVEFQRVMPDLKLVPHPIWAGSNATGGTRSWHRLALEYSKYIVSLLRARFIPPPSITAKPTA